MMREALSRTTGEHLMANWKLRPSADDARFDEPRSDCRMER
jgi:hypothetical protein